MDGKFEKNLQRELLQARNSVQPDPEVLRRILANLISPQKVSWRRRVRLNVLVPVGATAFALALTFLNLSQYQKQNPVPLEVIAIEREFADFNQVSLEAIDAVTEQLALRSVVDEVLDQQPL